MLVKYIHISCVILTLSFFIVRGIWMMQDSTLLKKIQVRILSATIDTILLVSAIIQAIYIKQYPFTHDWLTAKVLALVIYISLGMVAFSYGKTKNIRVTAWLAALLCFAYIVSVALTRNPTIYF